MAAELQCHELRAGYGRLDVLRGVNCRFTSPHLTCILGPNGAGKTTLLHAMVGRLPPHGGSIQLNGTDILKLKPRERARLVALVPQLAAESVPLTVREAVALARYARRREEKLSADTDDAAVLAALKALSLDALADKPCHAISGGEWRRVLIAQGLAQQAQVLLLDEPTAFLDPPQRHYIMAVLRDLAHSQGLIIVVVLHDPVLAVQFADHAVLLRDGEVIAAGEAAQVLTTRELMELYDSPVYSGEWMKELK